MAFSEFFEQYLAGRMELGKLRSALENEVRANTETGPAYRNILDNAQAYGRLPEDVHSDLCRTIIKAQSTGAGPHDRNAVKGPNTATLPHASDQRPGGSQGTGPETAHPASAPFFPDVGTEMNWSDMNSPTAMVSIGSVIGAQFVLEEEIGRGGMGVVYKALDVKAKAAKDRNPYVAIKLLSEEFKQHPDCLIQLQRETKKAQFLSHPNIVNVFGFNFDVQNAWMVMEYLDGYPLNNLRGKLLAREDAIAYIEQIASALEHAHGMRPHPLVHYDLKPGNIFLTRDGSIKLLDFGIARVAPASIEDKSDTTLFDPSSLGALTPSYASCEMLRDMDPDPRDDIYALGCVAYELLSGEHPWNRRAAIDAQAMQLRPKRIKGIKRRQNKAIEHALAFDRARRTPSARHFIDEFSGTREGDTGKGLWVSLAILVTAIGATNSIWLPVVKEEWRVLDISRTLAARSDDELPETVAEIQSLSREDKQGIFADRANAERILSFFRQRVGAAFDPQRLRYDYPAALAEIRRLEDILPASAETQELSADLENSRAAELLVQHAAHDVAVRKESLTYADGAGSLPGVLSVIRQLDASDARLAETSIASRYMAGIETALLREDFDRATQLVRTVRILLTQEQALAQFLNAEQRIDQARSGVVLTPKAAPAERLLGDFNAALTGGDLDQAGQYLAGFPASGLPENLRQQAADRLARDYLGKAIALVGSGDRDSAAAMIATGLALQPDSSVEQSLKDLQQSTVDSQRVRVDQAVAGVRNELDARLATGTFLLTDVGWAVDALARLNELGADPRIERQRIVERIVVSANDLLRTGAADDAYNLAKYANAFLQGAPEIQELIERSEIRIQQERQASPAEPEVPTDALSEVDELSIGLDELLQAEPLDSATSSARIRAQLRVLERAGGDGSAARQRVAAEYLARARGLAREGQIGRANVHLELARGYEPDSTLAPPPQTAAPAQTLTPAPPPIPAAGGSSSQQRFETAIHAGDTETARQAFDALRATLPSSDPYLENEATGMLVDAYVASALEEARVRDFVSALSQLDRALEISPADAKVLRYQDRFRGLLGTQ